MTREFDTRTVSGVLFRVGRRPDVWAWTDWAFAGATGIFDGRWDDPRGRYRVLYTSDSRLGAFLEVLAPFRPDLELLAELKRIRVNDRTGRRTRPAGRIPARWRDDRIVGRGVPDGVTGVLVVVGAARSLATLRRALARMARGFGLKDLDAAAIRLSAPRRFTQEVSRLIYEQADTAEAPFAGIFYLSRYGDDVTDCALFERGEPFPVTSLERSDISGDDADFLAACEMLGLEAD
jgi:hypothetical protein